MNRLKHLPATVALVAAASLGALAFASAYWLTHSEPAEPWDTEILRGQAPDSIAFTERADEPGVFCVWSWRGGDRYRVPAAAAGQSRVSADDTRYTDPVPLVGAHLCYLIEPNGSRT